MPAPSVTLLMAALMAFAVGMYVVLDGFDLGIGLLTSFAADDGERDVMMRTVAPYWDGNETWLVFGGATLMAAFPLAFSVILPAVYLPLIAMLLGLVFRGVAFEFRLMHRPRLRVWDRAFAWGSAVATFAQGVVLGAFVQGIRVVNGRYAGARWDWLTPFSIVTGLALLCGYALLGAAWLYWRGPAPLQARARRWLPPLLLGLLGAIAVISIWTPLASSDIAARWFSWPNIVLLSPVPLLTGVCAYAAWRTASSRPSGWPFALSVAVFFLGYTGLGISLFPQLPPPSLTLYSAAAVPQSQRFLLPGLLVLVPAILGYTWFNFRILRARAGDTDDNA